MPRESTSGDLDEAPSPLNSRGSGGLYPAPWSIKNTFLHVPNPSDDHAGIRKVKSANEMAMRFTQLAKDDDDLSSQPSMSDLLDDEDDVAYTPFVQTLTEQQHHHTHSESNRVLGQVRNVSFSTMPVVVEDDEPTVKKNPAEVTYGSVMVRNIPNRYSQHMLLAEIDKAGFKGKYKFFYLPIDFGQRANLGYAFIDFEDVAVAAKFVATFEGEKLRKFKSRKILTISPAVYQGLPANLNHFAKAALQRITNPRFQPKVFEKGVPVSFETAYTDLCALLTGVRVR
jgi:hypothetical protein